MHQPAATDRMESRALPEPDEGCEVTLERAICHESVQVRKYARRDSNQSTQARKGLSGSGKPPPPSAAKSDAIVANLQGLVETWPQLHEQLRTAILLMARAAE